MQHHRAAATTRRVKLAAIVPGTLRRSGLARRSNVRDAAERRKVPHIRRDRSFALFFRPRDAIKNARRM